MNRLDKTGFAATVTVYAAAFSQGLTLVSFPASSALLRQAHGLSDAQYGAIFLPQVALAIAGAISGGALAKDVGLRPLLIMALLFNALSQTLLGFTAMAPTSWVFPLLLTGTACLGLAFGLGGAPLNGYPPLLYPRHSNTAIVALHSLLGLGLMVGPILLNGFASLNAWQGFPGTLVVFILALAVIVKKVQLPSSTTVHNSQAVSAFSRHPVTSAGFWILVAITVLYAFAEGTFSNWAVVYLEEVRQFPSAAAASALSAFWGMLVAGRLLSSFLVLRLAPEIIWLLLPALMTLTFILLPAAASPAIGVSLFALAGVACSAFFPLTIAIACGRFPEHVAWVSSMLIAALMAGVGLGSFAIGGLRMMFSMEQLYLLSAGYPVLVLLLATVLWRKGALRTPSTLVKKQNLESMPG